MIPMFLQEPAATWVQSLCLQEWVVQQLPILLSRRRKLRIFKAPQLGLMLLILPQIRLGSLAMP